MPFPETSGKQSETPPVKMLGTLLPVSVTPPLSTSLQSDSNPQQNVIVLPPTADSSIPLPHPLSTEGFTNKINSTTEEKTDIEIEETKSDEEMKTLIINTFDKLLEMCSDNMQEKKVSEVKRRLQILSDYWRDGKLSNDIKFSLYKLVNAILKKKYDLADNIHLSLMMDHFSEVGTWMVGVKHLLHEAKERNAFVSEEVVNDDNL